jgi:two-component system NarL family response regulator
MIVDDHAIMREGLSMIIATQPDIEVVAEAGDGPSAVAMFRRTRPDVTLMDLRLPGMSGVEAIAAIRSEFGDARFIVLTTYEGDEDIYSALKAGARGYLLKGMTREHLLDSIRAVAAGKKSIPPGIANRMAENVMHEHLSPREMDVLELITGGLSNKEIAAKLEITEFTVKFHVKSILGKLGVRDRTHALAEAIKRGIIHL